MKRQFAVLTTLVTVGSGIFSVTTSYAENVNVCEPSSNKIMQGLFKANAARIRDVTVWLAEDLKPQKLANNGPKLVHPVLKQRFQRAVLDGLTMSQLKPITGDASYDKLPQDLYMVDVQLGTELGAYSQKRYPAIHVVRLRVDRQNNRMSISPYVNSFNPNRLRSDYAFCSYEVQLNSQQADVIKALPLKIRNEWIKEQQRLPATPKFSVSKYN